MKKYELLIDELHKLVQKSVEKGILQFPTEMELCKRYDVSRVTVRRALWVLENEHLIERRQGSGCRLTGLLPKGEDNTIAVIFSSQYDYIFPDVLHVLRTQLADAGYTVAAYESRNDFERERGILQELLHIPPRCILAECFSTIPNPNVDLYTQLQESGVPIVMLYGSYPNFPAFPVVADDNMAGGRMLVDYLARRGHRKIAGVFRWDRAQGMNRLYGFLSGLKENHLSFSSNKNLLIDENIFRDWEKHDFSQSEDFFTNVLPECSALVCFNDEIAYLLMNELERRGIHAPEDLSIVSFDNSYLRILGSGIITSLAHEKHAIGLQAVDLILRTIKGQAAPSAYLPWKLVRGNSDAALKRK